MKTTTYRELFEDTLDDWIGRGSGIVAVLDLIHHNRDVWLFFFVRWLQEQFFPCEKCGKNFTVEDLNDLEGMAGIVCSECRAISL